MSDLQSNPDLTGDDQQLVVIATERLENKHTAGQHVATAERASLLGLPQELRDIIIEFAYPVAETITYIGHDDWHEREKARRRANGPEHASSPFKHEVDDWTISKAFFVDAARIFVRSQSKIWPGPSQRSTYSCPTGICYAYTTAVSVSTGTGVRFCRPLPMLSTMTISVCIWDFEDWDTGCVWRRTLTVDELQDLKLFRELMRFNSLRSIVATDGEWNQGQRTAHERAVWQSNIRLFQKTVNESLAAKNGTETQQCAQEANEPKPLYLGSRVLFTSLSFDDAAPSSNANDDPSNQQDGLGKGTLGSHNDESSSAGTSEATYLDNQLFIYNPRQPWPMLPRRLQRLLPEPAGLLNIPQELKDIGVLPRGPLDQHNKKAQKRRGGSPYVPSPFPYTINKLLVSKAFFVEAARPFVKYHCPIVGFFGALSTIHGKGVVFALTTTVTIRPSGLFDCMSMPNLVSIRLKMNPDGFEDYDTGCVFERIYSEEEILELDAYRHVLRCEKLRQVEVLDGDYGSHRRTPAELEMWKANLALFQEMVNDQLEEIRPCVYQNPMNGRLPLYEGSHVRFGTISGRVPYRFKSTTKASESETQPDDQVLPLKASGAQVPEELGAQAESDSPKDASPTPPTLLTLPKEIRGIIFQLAYPYMASGRTGKVRGRNRDLFEMDEKRRSKAEGSAFIPAVFPYMVNDIMVSKAFFVESAAAYVGNRTGITKEVEGPAGPRVDGIWFAYITKATIEGHYLREISYLPHVTHLKVSPSWLIGDFDAWHVGGEWNAVMTEDELLQHSFYRRLTECENLRVAIIASNEDEAQMSTADKAAWRENLQNLQAAVDKMLRDKQQANRQSLVRRVHGHVPFYSGSLVSARSSYLPMPVGLQLPAAGQLRNREVPETVADVHELLFRRPAVLLDWMQRAKLALCQINQDS
ncbi:hypothetical protein LTR56_021110 [Elasticomyces elasticus]|nr:hypothetical protein LTR56_021110 [Elasticomyces elasticus]KAK3631922.1 hypothetical protein LTR22_020855 [Elasticomyces elasticus]KAK4909712.1 hypothetical protein LTR49_021524 [Elasticomyces elasticus]KAK5749584.1 hypothetical protein LTS12_020371 [Elasticomyces elasticus]